MTENVYSNEAYRQGDTIIVVHERREGQVYCHWQKFNELYVGYDKFFRMTEADFADYVAEAKRFDVNELPAAREVTTDA